jgi:hypothetical protein
MNAIGRMSPPHPCTRDLSRESQQRPVACLAVADVAVLADVSDSQRRDGGPELVIRGEYPVIAMPVLPQWRREKTPQIDFPPPREL